jgi:asparagine synthase (glutamine-hydrolysing)
LLASDVRRSVAEAAEYSPASTPHPVTFAAFREIPWNLFGTLAAGRSQVTFRTPYLDNELVALAFQAPLIQRTSPLPALRLINRNHPRLGSIPTDRGQVGETRGPRWALRRLIAEVTFKLDYLQTEGMPGFLAPLDPLFTVLRRTGFLGLHKFLPYRRWFQKELSARISEVLTDPRTRDAPWWKRAFLDGMANDHARGRKNYVSEINAVLTLEAIDRLIVRPTHPAATEPTSGCSVSSGSYGNATRLDGFVLNS